MKNKFNKTKYPNCHKGHQYALDILSGQIAANIWVKGACQRYLNDLKRIEEDPKCSFYFLPDKAEKYLRLVQRFCHVKGVWPTKEIIYLPWQNFIFMNIMGFYSHHTKERRFRTAHIDVSRGQGKSCIASQTCLYFLALDSPKGNEIYACSTKKEQSRLVLDSSRAMARGNTSFLKNTGVEVRAHEIIHPPSNSFVRALSSNHNSQDGLAAVLVIADELHAMDKKMFDVVDSGMSKRRDSLLLCITTAGRTTESAGYSQRAYAQKVCLGEIKDETFFAIVYRIDKEDEDTWYKEDCWIKANPGLGEIVDLINFRAKANKARNNPPDKPNFLCKHLNLYQNSMDQFFNVTKWNSCHDPKLTIEQLIGKPCYIGIDLSSKNDLTSFSAVFKEDDKYVLLNQNFCPEEAIHQSSNMNYEDYINEGSLIATPGAAISYDVLKKFLLEWNRLFKIRECFYDSWQANQFAIEMLKERINMVEFRMNTSSLSEPTKVLEAASRNKDLRHFGTKIMSWMIGNVVCRYDAANNVFPRKENEKHKIDGAVSSIMGIAGHIRDEQKQSVYEKRDIIVI